MSPKILVTTSIAQMSVSGSIVILGVFQELYVTGLPTLPDYTTQKPMDDHLNMICHLANALWAVIQMNRRTLELKRETETKLITLDSDNNSLMVW